LKTNPRGGKKVLKQVPQQATTKPRGTSSIVRNGGAVKRNRNVSEGEPSAQCMLPAAFRLTVLGGKLKGEN